MGEIKTVIKIQQKLIYYVYFVSFTVWSIRQSAYTTANKRHVNTVKVGKWQVYSRQSNTRLSEVSFEMRDD